ncbi:hypothetical protein EWM64_g9003 [Hericium alpestre]|uniref:Uncharacterized protein n=1 Tax=Hericium alpestre TaxID=135208 RepID=A0A4Y9ZJM8_9AGAM|nr:hypothetical protein EWM64_g9003 [Hericium alpestre]
MRTDAGTTMNDINLNGVNQPDNGRIVAPVQNPNNGDHLPPNGPEQGDEQPPDLIDPVAAAATVTRIAELEARIATFEDPAHLAQAAAAQSTPVTVASLVADPVAIEHMIQYHNSIFSP